MSHVALQMKRASMEALAIASDLRSDDTALSVLDAKLAEYASVLRIQLDDLQRVFPSFSRLCDGGTPRWD